MKPSIWNLLTIVVLAVLGAVLLCFLTVFVNPQVGINPFPPPTLPPRLELPTATATFLSMPATWTPGTGVPGMPTATHKAYTTVTPMLTRTGFRLPTFTPTPTITPTPTDTPTITPTRTVTFTPVPPTRTPTSNLTATYNAMLAATLIQSQNQTATQAAIDSANATAAANATATQVAAEATAAYISYCETQAALGTPCP